MHRTGTDGPGETDRRTGLAGSSLLALARSASGALVSVALPLVLSRLLTDDRFSVWTIAMQAFLYGTFLEAGITLAVSRAAAAHRTDTGTPVSLVLRAGQRVARAPISIAVAAYVALVAALPVLYGRVPDSLVATARISVAIMGLGSVATIATLPAQGYLQGLGLFRSATLPLIVGTFGAALGATVAAAVHAPVWIAAAAFAGARGASAVVVDRHARRLARGSGAPPAPSTTERMSSIVAEVRSTVGTMWIWSFAGFLGSGLDLTIVSWADYPSVRPYAIGAAITAALSGVAAAVVTVLVPRVARTTAAFGADRPLDTGAEGRVAAWIISCAALPLVTAAAPLSNALGGDTSITLVLLAGAWLRISMTPFVAALVGAGDHRALRGSPLAEGIANVGLGVLLAPRVGAIGVAAATLVSGVFGVGMHLFWNIPRSSLASIRAPRLPLRIHGPAAIAFAVAALVGRRADTPVTAILAVALVSTIGAVALLLAAVDRPERQLLVRRITAPHRAERQA